MTAETISGRFDSKRFRQVLGHLPVGVVAVSAIDDGEPVGLTVASFTSVSLNPPLVGFCPSRSSSSWPRIRRTGAFAVSVLAEHQADVSSAFAVSGGDKFADRDWHRSPTGLPVLDGAIAWLECAIVRVVEAGDHWFVLARVVDLAAMRGRRPLVFFLGGYTGLTR